MTVLLGVLVQEVQRHRSASHVDPNTSGCARGGATSSATSAPVSAIGLEAVAEAGENGDFVGETEDFAGETGDFAGGDEGFEGPAIVAVVRAG